MAANASASTTNTLSDYPLKSRICLCLDNVQRDGWEPGKLTAFREGQVITTLGFGQ